MDVRCLLLQLLCRHSVGNSACMNLCTKWYLGDLPFCVAAKAVANDNHLCQLFGTPVGPQQVVIHCLPTVRHVEQGGKLGWVLA